MALVRGGETITVRLNKPLTRAIKRGHLWLYSDAIELPAAAAGSVARLIDRDGKQLASGIYCRQHPIPLRICASQPPYDLDDRWLIGRLESALGLREAVADAATSGYRLVAGEGDGVPGLIVDRYDRTAVIKLDGGAPQAFYQPLAIAGWLAQRLDLEAVVLRPRGRATLGQVVQGTLPGQPVPFLENGLRLTADVIQGQKTGFFLDQRDNRALIQHLARGRRVLNLFSFNGGFSIAAGIGGARDVTSVDIAPAAIAAATDLWLRNGLPPAGHTGIVADCFQFLETAVEEGRRWDLAICDPPSFAPSQQALPRALNAYARLAERAARVVESGGLLALASCSSHVPRSEFERANLEGLGRARRVAKLIAERGLPLDHPTPLAMPELRYLKFQLFQLS